ncbi:hypothetical protein PV08_04544 [Exophiala spinifera]|uniref:SET domain-containing protein n=1 Tax=Exophiala spinifera TaxID=91928 RepID=A0A0D1ZXE5_9EURO|nr:uncharacterized protein PV08_04544 [Exophiala spinifera]KIW17352.1 hypothetical protein PV08_04544 [Exophiala spinifera]
MAPTTRGQTKKTTSRNENHVISDQALRNGPRRGTRRSKPTERYIDYQNSLKGHRRSKQGSDTAEAVDKFMIQLYAEIVGAAVSPGGPLERTEIQDLIRQARTLRFFDLYPKDIADELKGTLKKSSLPASETRRRFIVQSTIFSFRAAIQRDNADSKTEGLPKWGDVLLKIKKFSSSLELVAKTRKLDWGRASRASEADYDRLIKCCFKGNQHVRNNIDLHNFGIGASDLDQLHHPTDLVPHHWVLPKRKEPARRCQFEYQYNSDLDKEDFYGRRVPGRLNGGGRPTTGDRQLAWQVDMAESRVLDTYDWPKLSDEANGDPRFNAQGRCYSCDKTANCSCTMSDYYERHNGQPDALVELFDTEKLGTGVRALQALRKGAMLGEYIGEIYPLRDVSRYRTEMYVFGMEVGQRRQTKRRKGAGQNGDAGGGPVNLIVDPAIYGNWTRYINHSCEPNAAYTFATIGQRQVILIQALRDINFGEEVTSDYGEGYFTNMNLKCVCGAEKCRSKR